MFCFDAIVHISLAFRKIWASEKEVEVGDTIKGVVKT